MNYSQTVAKIFEIVCYPLFIPGILGVIFSVFYIIPLVISLPCFAVGTLLFIGYYKHSRGTLDEKYLPLLWLGSAVFNLIPLLLAYSKHGFDYSRDITENSHDIPAQLILFVVSWWLASVILATTAFFYDLKN